MRSSTLVDGEALGMLLCFPAAEDPNHVYSETCSYLSRKSSIDSQIGE